MKIIDVAKMFFGIRYDWGGNSPLDGMDCSGFVCEVLRSLGYLQDDYSAQGLFTKFSKLKNKREFNEGSLIFFGKNQESITHIAIALDDKLMIEAGGGGSKTNTIQDSIKSNAYVRIRPIKNRKDFVAVITLEEN